MGNIFTDLVLRSILYPPERILVEVKTHLATGGQSIGEIPGIGASGKAVVLEALASSVPLSNVRVSADGVADIVRIDSFSASVPYPLKVTALDRLQVTGESSSETDAVVAALVRVEKPTPVLKYLSGKRLTSEELARLTANKPMYEKLLMEKATPFNPYTNISVLLPFEKTLSSSGTVFTYNVPPGYKLVLLDLYAEVSGTAYAYIDIERDYVDLPGIYKDASDPLPSIRDVFEGYSLYITALDNMRIELDHRAPGNDIVVGGLAALVRLSIPDKIRLGKPLTPEEQEIAEAYGLRDLVEAGYL